MSEKVNQRLILSVQHALNGDWHAAHKIAQDYNTLIACWIHAVLHKIEPDEWNSRYWYARSGGHYYEEFTDAQVELQDIFNQLNITTPTD